MRLRLESESPLPPLRAWFFFTSNNDDEDKISDLKHSICTTLDVFKTAGTSVKQIRLELDGFEVLDEMRVRDLLREGDLLTLKYVPGQAAAGKRKKAQAGSSSPVAVKKQKTVKRIVKDSSSSEESSSDDSDSDESLSSSSSSGSGSSSSSSASSRSSHAPLQKPISKPSKRLLAHPIPLASPASFVPPGHGTSSTKSRNARRRKKRLHSRVVDAPTPPQALSDVNAQPLGERLLAVPLPASTAPILNMFSMGNKNKKKGYKQSLAPPTSQRITFDFSAFARPSTSMSTPGQENAASASTSTPTARFVPPSEREDLPTNLFVTSVDVEEGIWTNKTNKGKAKGKGKQKIVLPEIDYNASFEDCGILSLSTDAWKNQALDIDVDFDSQVVLDYGSAGDLDESDWLKAEKEFDNLEKVTSLDQLPSGVIACWKALDLNPITFSPEIMLHMARVESLDSLDLVEPISKDDPFNGVVIKMLTRPSYGYTGDEEEGQVNEWQGGEMEEEKEEEKEEGQIREVTMKLASDVFGEGWRIFRK